MLTVSAKMMRIVDFNEKGVLTVSAKMIRIVDFTRFVVLFDLTWMASEN